MSLKANCWRSIRRNTRLYLPGDFVNTMNEYCHDGCHFVGMVGPILAYCPALRFHENYDNITLSFVYGGGSWQER